MLSQSSLMHSGKGVLTLSVMALKESLRCSSDLPVLSPSQGRVAVPKVVFPLENILIALPAKVTTKANIIRLKVT